MFRRSEAQADLVTACAPCHRERGRGDRVWRSYGRRKPSERTFGGVRRVTYRRRADHGHRFAARPADHCLRQKRLDPASAGIEWPEGTRDARRYLQRHPERSRALLEPV